MAVFRNFAYSAVSTGTAALLLILMIGAARVLGETEFGKFTFALTFGGLFETLMDFGLHQVTIRAVARNRSQAASLLQHALAIKLLWAAVTLTVLCAAATLLRPQWDVRFACYLIGGSLVFRSYMLTIRGVLQGLEHFGWDSIVAIADRGLLLAFGLAALWMGTGLRGLALAFVLARGAALAVAAVLTHFQLGGFRLRYDREVWRDLHATALPLGFFLVVLNLYSYVDSVMLGVMRTDAETGLYVTAGWRFAPLQDRRHSACLSAPQPLASRRGCSSCSSVPIMPAARRRFACSRSDCRSCLPSGSCMPSRSRLIARGCCSRRGSLASSSISGSICTSFRITVRAAQPLPPWRASWSAW